MMIAACLVGAAAGVGLLVLGYLLGRRRWRRRGYEDAASSCFVNAAFLLVMADAVRNGQHAEAAERLADYGRKLALAWRSLSTALPAAAVEKLKDDRVYPKVCQAADACEAELTAAGLPTSGAPPLPS